MPYPDPEAHTGSHLANTEVIRSRIADLHYEGSLHSLLNPDIVEVANVAGLPNAEMQDIINRAAPRPTAIGPQSRFRQLIAEMVETHDTKNRDYADSAADPLRNFRRCEEVGIPAHIGCWVRIGDKVMRVENLLRRMQAGGDGPAVKSESVIDTLKDLAVYALIEIELIEQHLAKTEPDGTLSA